MAAPKRGVPAQQAVARGRVLRTNGNSSYPQGWEDSRSPLQKLRDALFPPESGVEKAAPHPSDKYFGDGKPQSVRSRYLRGTPGPPKYVEPPGSSPFAPPANDREGFFNAEKQAATGDFAKKYWHFIPIPASKIFPALSMRRTGRAFTSEGKQGLLGLTPPFLADNDDEEVEDPRPPGFRGTRPEPWRPPSPAQAPKPPSSSSSSSTSATRQLWRDLIRELLNKDNDDDDDDEDEDDD